MRYSSSLYLSHSCHLKDLATAIMTRHLKKAIATFAIAKTLNASISFLQGTEIEGSLVFASATFSVGEILDPLNDLVERFSWIMLASAVALGIEKTAYRL